MSENNGNKPAFSELAAGLSDQCKAEFFKTLHEAGIGPKDAELARLLRALQLYKAYYETIPDAIQKVVEVVGKIKEEMVLLSAATREGVRESVHMSSLVMTEAEKFTEKLNGIPARLEDALSKSTDSLAEMVAESISSCIKETVLTPMKSRLADLTASNQAFEDAIAQCNHAVAVLKNSVETTRRLKMRVWKWGGIAFLIGAILGMWIYFHWSYANQTEGERTALVGELDKNRSLLLELAKTHRTLELHQDPDDPSRKFIILKDPSGAQSARKHGVIEFQE